MKYYAEKDVLKEIKELSKEEEVVIVCIGTDKHVMDSLGPMVGSMLEKYHIKTYGNLNNPITAINVEEVKEEVERVHMDSIIIAIDIAVTVRPELDKKIHVRRGGIKPGTGVGITNLSPVGDYSILYYVYEKNMDNERIRNPYNGALEMMEVIKSIFCLEE